MNRDEIMLKKMSKNAELGTMAFSGVKLNSCVKCGKTLDCDVDNGNSCRKCK